MTQDSALCKGSHNQGSLGWSGRHSSSRASECQQEYSHCTMYLLSSLSALPAVPGEFHFHSTLMGKFCFWTVEKSRSATTPFPFCKLQRSGLGSLCQLFSPFLWRGCGCEMQSLECYYTTLSKTFQCWVPQVPMYGLAENSAFRVSLWEQA